MGLDDPENLRLEALLGLSLVFFTAFTVIDKMPSTATFSGLVGVMGTISWLCIPYIIYRDVEELPEIGWRPHKYLYAFASLLPYVNITFVVLYVLKRQRINEAVKKGSRNFFRGEWWKAVLGSAALFLIGATIFSAATGASSDLTLLGDIGMLLLTAGWIGVPLSISFDRTFLKQHGAEFGSRLNKASVIPFIGVVAAILYFIERQSKVSGQKQRNPGKSNRYR